MTEYVLLAAGVAIGAVLRPLVDATVALLSMSKSAQPDRVDVIGRLNNLPPTIKGGS